MAFVLKNRLLRDALRERYGAMAFDTELLSDRVTEQIKTEGRAVLHFGEDDHISITRDMVFEEYIFPEGNVFGGGRIQTDFVSAMFYFVKTDAFGDGQALYVDCKPCQTDKGETEYRYDMKFLPNGKAVFSGIAKKIPNAESAHDILVLYEEKEKKQWLLAQRIKKNGQRKLTNEEN